MGSYICHNVFCPHPQLKTSLFLLPRDAGKVVLIYLNPLSSSHPLPSASRWLSWCRWRTPRNRRHVCLCVCSAACGMWVRYMSKKQC